MNILVTDIASYKAVVFITHASKDKSINIFSADYRLFTKYFRSKYARNHTIIPNFKKDKENYLNSIYNLCKEKKIEYIVPINSIENRLLLFNKEKFGNLLDIFGTYDSFNTLDNKRELMELAQNLNIRTPLNFNFNCIPENISFPIVYKPLVSSSSKGVFYIKNYNDLERKMNKTIRGNDKEYLLQQYITGIGVGYSVLTKDGKILIGCGHKRIAEYPITGGSSTIRAAYKNNEMHIIAEKIIKATNWSGFAMFEFKLTRNNELYLIEVNPRIWGSINQSISMGINFPLYLLMNNKIEKDILYRNKIVTYFSPFHIFSIFNYIVLKLNFSPLIFFLKNIFNAKPDISIRKDFNAYIASLLMLFR